MLNALDLKFETETALVAAPPTRPGPARCRIDAELAKGGRRHPVRRGGRLEVRQARAPLRPEQAILGPAQEPGPVRQLPPAICYEQLTRRLQPEARTGGGLDILIIRELTATSTSASRAAPHGGGRAFPGAEKPSTPCASRPEIERIAHVAFQAARKRSKKVTSVDKANVLETFQFWKDVVTEVHAPVPGRRSWSTCTWTTPRCSWSRRPKKFDVVVTGNMFGDILSDEGRHADRLHRHAASASLTFQQQGPCTNPATAARRHRRSRASPNPLATILSLPMMLASRSTAARPPTVSSRRSGAGRRVCARRTSGARARPRSARARWATPSWPPSPPITKPLPRARPPFPARSRLALTPGPRRHEPGKFFNFTERHASTGKSRSWSVGRLARHGRLGADGPHAGRRRLRG